MKTSKQFIAMALIAILALAFTACPTDSSTVGDTTKTFKLGTVNCKVTIKSDDNFTTAEWNTLCNSVVAAIGRGYNSAGAAVKVTIEEYFQDNTVSAILLKSATYDCEVKSSETNIMYLKANVSAIDGLTGDEMVNAISAVITSSESFPTP